MSTFLDLEASVAHVESSDSEEEDDDFIADEEVWDSDDATDLPTADLFVDVSTALVEEDRWGDLLERARVRASASKIPLDGSEGFNLSLLDAAPGFWVLSCWLGWEDIVVFHIGRCARPEQGVKAAFIMPLIERQVWLEADMSADLKSWLVDIPGVLRRNQQVVLHAVSHEESRRTLSSTLPPVVIPGSWMKVRRGPSKGDIGMVSKLYPWGCKMLLVPMFYPRDRTYRPRLGPNLIPKLFDPTAINTIEKGHSRYRSRGFTYEYDLLIKRFQFSLVQSVLDIPGSLATVFAQSRHPQIRRNISSLPRISEWCFQIGDKITDTSRGQSGAIRHIGEQSLEVDFAEGLFSVRWADCRKDFQIGQYVEISEGTVGGKWSGWISAVENEILELIRPHESTMETRSVHPNAVIATTEPASMCTAPATTSPNWESTANVPWKGTMVRVTRKSYRWGGKTGYLIDVSVTVDPNMGHRVLKLLVQLVHYDPNAPFLCVWFSYDDVVEEESWLPLNEARPLEDKHDFFCNLVPETNVLATKGRHIPSPPPFLPQRAEEPGNATPLPDPSEHCLSPAWNPSSSDPPSHWCIDPRLLSAKFRVCYNGCKIVALVKRDWQRNIVCVKDDTPGDKLDPARVLAIHPTIRHYDMFLVISGPHCGKWVRSIQFKKCSPDNVSDLVWTVAVVIPGAPFLPDDVTDERLTLHNSMMTLAEETKESKALNSNLKKQLRLRSRD